jgi:hypothetical protein
LLKLKKILCVLEHREELELAFITDGNWKWFKWFADILRKLLMGNVKGEEETFVGGGFMFSICQKSSNNTLYICVVHQVHRILSKAIEKKIFCCRNK